MVSKADTSRVRVQICPSHAVAELTIPATWALPALGPEPVPPVIPALVATRVRLATVAARYSWNRVWHGRSWTLRNSSGVSKGIDKSVVQSGRDFPYIRVGGGQ